MFFVNIYYKFFANTLFKQISTSKNFEEKNTRAEPKYILNIVGIV